VRCAACGATLGHVTARGDPMLRTRGLVLKAEGVTAICPRCKADVPMTGELAQALRARLLVFVPAAPPTDKPP